MNRPRRRQRRLLRRLLPPRRQVADALRAGDCLFAAFGTCQGGTARTLLTDIDAVLVCDRHRRNLADIRAQAPRELQRLDRALRVAFADRVAA